MLSIKSICSVKDTLLNKAIFLLFFFGLIITFFSVKDFSGIVSVRSSFNYFLMIFLSQTDFENIPYFLRKQAI